VPCCPLPTNLMSCWRAQASGGPSKALHGPGAAAELQPTGGVQNSSDLCAATEVHFVWQCSGFMVQGSGTWASSNHCS
jgi:hypothetical protein